MQLRYRFLIILGISVLTLAALVASAGASTSTQGADIFGTGGGHVISNQFGTFDFSAHMGPSGDFGHVSLTQPDLQIYVDVDCVNIFGVPGVVGQAWIAGTVKRVSPVPNFYGIQPGDRQQFWAEDGGQPSAAPNDAFYTAFNYNPNCKLNPPLTLPPDVTQGNVTIKTG